MKNWLQKFLMGRNGPDELSRLCSLLGCILAVFSIFCHGVFKTLFWAAAILCLVLCYSRLLSRNVYARRLENQRYLQWKTGLKQGVGFWRIRWSQRRAYRFYRCAQCRAWVRVPRGRGRIQITCPKCRSQFIRKS